MLLKDGNTGHFERRLWAYGFFAFWLMSVQMERALLDVLQWPQRKHVEMSLFMRKINE